MGVRCELTLVAAGTDELFVSGFPPWCTVMVLPQAFVWLFFQVSLRWHHVWINVSLIFDDVFSTGCQTDGHLL